MSRGIARICVSRGKILIGRDSRDSCSQGCKDTEKLQLQCTSRSVVVADWKEQKKHRRQQTTGILHAFAPRTNLE